MIKPFSTTGIGSLPHLVPEDACRLILDTFDIPFWPQLPQISFKEFMIPQYSEGMPLFKIDTEKQTIWIEKNSSDEIERFYESCSDTTRIAISEDYAVGLHTFLRLIKNRTFPFIKGHTTGPLTFTLGLKDREGRLVFFDEELREISLMLLKAKIRWQIDILKTYTESVIIFIDEPIFSALGSSSYLGVNTEEVIRLLRETIDAVKSAGGIAGIHCCGNADWPLVIKSGADIINFDAFDYIDTIAIYHAELRDFLEKGGLLAWGIVPTFGDLSTVSPESVLSRFNKGLEKLSRNIPEELILSNILLTPSCGTGSRTVEETIKIFQLLMRLKEDLT